MSLIIGSGDVARLISGKKTKGYRELWKKFIDTEVPYYNALASPIDALRTGAILEIPYLNFLGDDYYPQVKVDCESQNVLRVSLDFAKFMKGKLVDFEELKTIFLTDFIEIIRPMKEKDQTVQQDFIKSKFKKNFFQIQSQLLATGLESAKLSFLAVESYDDDENAGRIINENDVVKFEIKRDAEAVEFISSRLVPFQYVKVHFDQK